MPNETSTAVAEYSPTAAALAELRGRLAGVVYDTTTAAGMDIARKDRRECVTLRTNLEAKRKELKAPIIDRGRLLDEEAKRITAELLALEMPIDEQIRRREAEIEAERERKRQAEARRVDKIHADVDAIRRFALRGVGSTSERIGELIAELEALAVDATSFAEFVDMAQNARTETIATLRTALDAALVKEADEARIAEERAELARQRAEQARLDSEAAQRRAAEEAAAQAERARLDAIAQAEREAAFRAEQERHAAENAAAEAARAEADRIAREAREAEASRMAEERARIALEREALELRQQAEAAAAQDRRRQEAAAEQARRQEAEEARIALLASDPVKALREIMAVLTDTATYADDEARATVLAIAGATLRTLEAQTLPAKRKAAA